MAASSLNLSYRPVPSDDIPAAFALESAGFPADEAASLATLQYRQSIAPELFYGAYDAKKLIGFTCSTLTPSSTLTHESMSTHIPSAAYVAIHSVCVSASYRRTGVALSLLQHFVEQVKLSAKFKGCRLITHEELVELYGKCGFEMVGESAVVHGERKWYEMKIDFPSVPVEVVEKEEEMEMVRNPGKTLESFGGGEVGMAALVDGQGMNKAKLYCPRGECRCLLLNAGVGKWVKQHSSDFLLPELPQPLTSSIVASSSSSGYWSIPSPLSFENIGFSRNAAPPTPSQSSSSQAVITTPIAAVTVKYLICADCDHGPLGWHDTEGRDLGLEVEVENEGKGGQLRKGREFLLSVERVRYAL